MLGWVVVAMGQSIGVACAMCSPGGDFVPQLHQRLGAEANHFAKEARIASFSEVHVGRCRVIGLGLEANQTSQKVHDNVLSAFTSLGGTRPGESGRAIR